MVHEVAARTAISTYFARQPAPDWDPIGGPIVPGDFPAHPDAAELVRSTYPPSATAQRARELLLHEADDGNEVSWHTAVRDFLREIAEEKP
jgi:hypothetical protein